jgi:hypothetical protein
VALPDPVPHDPLFDSAWLKWGRALVHAQTLQAQLNAIGTDEGDEPTFTVRTDYQPKRHGFAVIIVDIDPMPPIWGLLLGDIANNLRSALDQIAWAVVTRGRTPPETLSKGRRRQIYFPIGKDRASLAPASGRARTSTLAGFALIVISSPVAGLRPLRAFVAGLRRTVSWTSLPIRTFSACAS